MRSQQGPRKTKNEKERLQKLGKAFEKLQRQWPWKSWRQAN